MRRLPIMPLVSGVVVVVFGGLTLALQDKTFIMMKPTIVNTLFGVVLLGGLAFGKSLLSVVLDSMFALTEDGWRKLTFRWGVFFLVLAVINEVVWRTQTEDFWVSFKVFGIMPLTIAFALAQTPLLMRHERKEPDAGPALISRELTASLRRCAEDAGILGLRNPVGCPGDQPGGRHDHGFRCRRAAVFRAPASSSTRSPVVTPARRTPSISDSSLVGQRQILAVGPVVAHQQPAGEALLDGEMRIAETGLGELHGEDLSVAQQVLVQRPALGQCRPECLRVDAQGPARHLNEGGVRRAIDPVEQGDADHTLWPDDPGLDSDAVGRVGDHGDHARLREMHGRNRLARDFEHAPPARMSNEPAMVEVARTRLASNARRRRLRTSD